MKRHLILTIIVGIITATGGAAIADELNSQPKIPSKPNPQLTKLIIIEGESPPQQPKLVGRLKIPKIKPLKLERSQQLPSDRLINRTLNF